MEMVPVMYGKDTNDEDDTVIYMIKNAEKINSNMEITDAIILA